MSYLKLGTWNAYCDVCAKKYKSDQLRLRWDGFMVCKKDWEPRHPQDFLRGVQETSNQLPWTRPVDFDGPVPQIPKACNNITGSSIPSFAVAGCMTAGATLVQSIFKTAPIYFDFTTGSLKNLATNPNADVITFTRNSIATRINEQGKIEVVAANVPRIDYDPITGVRRGLLVEEARTNLVLNSDVGTTQSVAVTSTAFSISFYGIGTVYLSGAYSGSLSGAGDFPSRAVLTFTPAAGTLTLTVSGQVRFMQLEAGSFPTSYIPTSGAQVTRAADVMDIPGSYSFGGTAFVEYMTGASSAGVIPIAMDLNKSSSNRSYIGYSSIGQGPRYECISSGTSGGITWFSTAFESPGGLRRAAATTTGGLSSLAVGGSIITSTGPDTSAQTADNLRVGSLGGTKSINSYIRRIAYWPRALSSTELQQITSGV